MKLRVVYFAVFRERLGKDQEDLELGVPRVRVGCHAPSLLYTWMAAPSTARAASARTSVSVG